MEKSCETLSSCIKNIVTLKYDFSLLFQQQDEIFGEPCQRRALPFMAFHINEMLADNSTPTMAISLLSFKKLSGCIMEGRLHGRGLKAGRQVWNVLRLSGWKWEPHLSQWTKSYGEWGQMWEIIGMNNKYMFWFVCFILFLYWPDMKRRKRKKSKVIPEFWTLVTQTIMML